MAQSRARVNWAVFSHTGAVATTWIFSLVVVGWTSCCTRGDSKPDDGGGDAGPYILQDCTGTVDFTDPGLETAVRWELGQHRDHTPYEGELTGEVLAEVWMFSAAGREIANLEGIECLRNLGYVWLDDNQLSDVSLLASLPRLETLGLSNNRMSDLRSVGALQQLRQIDVSGNPITSLAPVASLPWLHTLTVMNAGLTSVDDLAPLTGLRGLDISGNAITELGPLRGMTELVSLRASGNEISDLEPLAELGQLTQLRLAYNNIVQVDALDGLNALGEVDLSGNRIQRIDGLANKPALRVLYLHDNEVVDLAPLGTNPLLGDLTLHHNLIESLEPLVDLPFASEKTVFEFNDNRITDLSPLERFPQISDLDVSGNALQDLLPLGVHRIARLAAARNRIHDVRVVVSFLSPEAYIDLADNRLTHATPFVALAEAGLGPDRIVLLGNPLVPGAFEWQIPALCEAGVEVYFGNGETCPWHIDPEPYPVWNPDPSPVIEVEDTTESCDASGSWRAAGELPRPHRLPGEFLVEEEVNGEPVVRDTITGLIWRRCLLGMVWNGQTCTGTLELLPFVAARAACLEAYAGEADWGLADREALRSLVDYSTGAPGPTIEAGAFPGTASTGHWTDTALEASDGRLAWQINFYNGVTRLADTGALAAARCVRGTVGVIALEPRFSATGPGGDTVLDAWTGLMWQRCAQGQQWIGTRCDGSGLAATHAEAATACSMSWGGFDDWSLPDVVELASLASLCHYDPSIVASSFTGGDTGHFWSQTEVISSGLSDGWWVFDASLGYLTRGLDAERALVRCVRIP
jgi:Leucine-rich repeat (LRR) protein